MDDKLSLLISLIQMSKLEVQKSPPSFPSMA